MLRLHREDLFVIAGQGRASQLLCECISVSGQIVVDAQPVTSFCRGVSRGLNLAVCPGLREPGGNV